MKKFLSIVLAIVIVACVFVGCGNKEADTNAKKTTVAEQVSETPEETTEEITETPTQKIFTVDEIKGMTIGSYKGKSSSIVIESDVNANGTMTLLLQAVVSGEVLSESNSEGTWEVDEFESKAFVENPSEKIDFAAANLTEDYYACGVINYSTDHETGDTFYVVSNGDSVVLIYSFDPEIQMIKL